jgi:hypothetical protein
MACAYSPSSKLEIDKIQQIVKHIATLNSSVDESFRVWRATGYPIYHNHQAVIDTEPVLGEGGYKYYFRYICRNKKNIKWNCKEPEKRKIIELNNPYDRIDIIPDMNLEDAKNIINYVKKNIIIDEYGRYQYLEFRELKSSSKPLDISHLDINDNGDYEIILDGTVGCELHLINVKTNQCKESICEYEMLFNELIHLL